MPNPSGGDWSEYQRLVIAELERHSQALDSLAEKVSDLKAEIATRNELASLKAEFSDYRSTINSELSILKVKAGGWGAIAGALAALLPIVMMFLFNVIGKK